MPKKGFETCKKIHAELLKFQERKISKDSLEKIIGIVAGMDERTISKYIGWLVQLSFIRLDKDSDGKVTKNEQGYLIYEIFEYVLSGRI